MLAMKQQKYHYGCNKKSTKFNDMIVLLKVCTQKLININTLMSNKFVVITIIFRVYRAIM